MNLKRHSLRESCASLRKLLASAKPDGMEAILQEVGTVECDVLMANTEDLQAIEEKVAGLVRRLVEQGVIDAQRWREFFLE